MDGAAAKFLSFAAGAAIFVIVLRAALGPFGLGTGLMRVNSPLPAESVLWIALCGLLSARSKNGNIPVANTSVRLRYGAAAICLCLTALVFAGNLSDPFLSDDYILVSRVHSIGNPAFLTSLVKPGGDGAFRPCGTLYFQLVGWLAAFDPFRWHLCALGLHLLNTLLVYSIAFRLWRDTLSSCAGALVFGLNGTRPEVVVWTAGNFDLLACFFVLAAIRLALTDRDRQNLAVRAGAALLAVVGILSKESAYAAPIIGLSLLLFENFRKQARAFVVWSTSACLVLIAYRWYLFGGPGGYADPETGRPAILSVSLLSSIKGLFVRMWTILLVPVNWDFPTTAYTAFALAAALSALLILFSLGRRSGKEFGLMAVTIGSALPVIHLILIGQSGLGSRILYLPSVPFALFIGDRFIHGPGYRLLLLASLVAGSAGILTHNLNAWHDVAVEARKVCQSGAARNVPATRYGVFFFKNGFPECVTGTLRGQFSKE